MSDNSGPGICARSFYGKKNNKAVILNPVLSEDEEEQDESIDPEIPSPGKADDDIDEHSESDEEINSSTNFTIPVSGTQSRDSDINIQSPHARWRKRSPPQFDNTFKGVPLPPPPTEKLEPIEYFLMFFGRELFEFISEQTNLYAMQKSSFVIKTTPEEIEQYFGILILMSVIKLPQIRQYWTKETRVSCIADVMTGKRFEIIKRYVHFNDNSLNEGDDRLYKVRPIVDSVVAKCRTIPQEERQSIDEQMLPTKCRMSFKQYCPKKPNKWGIKVWARCGVSGLIYDFEVYTGKTNDPDDIPELMMGGNVVRRLLKTMPKNVYHKIYFDNYFSSIPLIRHLSNEGVLAVATIRRDRLKGADYHLKSEKVLKQEGRGSSDWVVDSNTAVCVVRWMDNGLVQLVSNYRSGEIGPHAKRWSKKEKRFIEIERPEIVNDYNMHMGGVDLCDMLLALYRIGFKSTKYYMNIIFYIVGISITNGWILYRRHCGQYGIDKKDQLSLLNFQTQVANSMMANTPNISKKRGRPSTSDNEASLKRRPPVNPTPRDLTRLDGYDHFPMFHEKQQRCRQCKKGYTHIGCTKCKVPLCLVKQRNCFSEFHGVVQDKF